jgi:hypothetical protein
VVSLSPARALLFLGIAIAVAAALAALRRIRLGRERREEANNVAVELIPEIRALLEACDSRLPASGAPPPAPRYALLRQRLPRILSDEALFAVETFYQSVAAYETAENEMRHAFAEGSTLALGDKIRAKDRRDRSLKDVFYTGEMAVERLSKGLD